jgi:hypothetical protein
MRVHLHVRDKTITVECGDGTQRIKWLANVGVARYDDSFGKGLGAPTGLQREGGVMCDPNNRVMDELDNDQHAFVVLDDSVAE